MGSGGPGQRPATATKGDSGLMGVAQWTARRGDRADVGHASVDLRLPDCGEAALGGCMTRPCTSSTCKAAERGYGAGGGAGDAISGPARFHLVPLPWRHPPLVLACTHPPKCGHGRSVRPATKQSGATVGQGSPPLSSPGLCVTFPCFRETVSRQRASENLGLGCAVMGPRPERQARALDCPKGKGKGKGGEEPPQA